MKVITDEQIKEMLYKRNKNVQFISSKIIVKGNKHRRLVTMRCECGNEFNKTLDHLNSDKHMMCNQCAREQIREIKKRHYNKKYKPLIEKNGYTLIDPNAGLYANKPVEVIQNDTWYRGFINPNRSERSMLIFSPEHNLKNYIYNVNQYFKNIGVGTRAIRFSDEERWLSRGIEFRCECGRTYIAPMRSFHNGKHYCDKCTRRYSTYETEVEKFLESQGIDYIHEFQVNSLRDVLPLRFDFCLTKGNQFIEIDSDLHRKIVKFGNVTDEYAQKRFEVYKKHDKMKDDYCEKYNIPLLRINSRDVLNGHYKIQIMEFIQTAQK